MDVVSKFTLVKFHIKFHVLRILWREIKYLKIRQNWLRKGLWSYMADSITDTMKSPLFDTFTYFVALFERKKIRKHIMCHISRVLCHVSLVTKDNGNIHRRYHSNSPIIHSRLIHRRVAQKPPKKLKTNNNNKLKK